MSFDFGTQLLEMLYYGAVNCSAEVCVLISDYTCVVAYGIVNVLETAFAKKLVAGAKRDLYEGTQTGEFPGGVVLNVCNSLEKDEKRALEEKNVLPRNRR